MPEHATTGSHKEPALGDNRVNRPTSGSPQPSSSSANSPGEYQMGYYPKPTTGGPTAGKGK